MAMITFESFRSGVNILNPFNEFTEETHTVEVRKDPLLGNYSIYNRALKDKSKFFFKDCDAQLIEKLIEESARTCLFCGNRLETNTPQYSRSLVPQGRIRVGEAVLFPNLYPLGKYHSVIVLSDAHFLKLSDFSPQIIGGGLRAAHRFVKAVYPADSDAKFTAINANYLAPAGATFVHPHLQMLITPQAYSYHERLLQACDSYRKRNNSIYHLDLVRQERETGLRYIAQRGRWHWLSVFSPMGLNEIMSVHESEHDFGLLDEDDLTALARGISDVLGIYARLGHLSFNYSILSARGSSNAEGFRCVVKMVCRQNLYPNYRNDDYFLQKLLHTETIINLPEDLAPLARKHFEEASDV